jgi:translation initiation factor 3 subunit F
VRRREQKDLRVLGTLLGKRDPVDGVIHITNCFAVPFTQTAGAEEDGEAGVQATFAVEYHDEMLALHRQMHPSESIVGWYITGMEVSHINMLIHEVYEKMEDRLSNVHLTLDTTLSQSTLGVKAYTALPVRSTADTTCMYTFQTAHMVYMASEQERIGIDTLINGNPESNELDAPATILTDLDHVELSLTSLRDNLETIQKYVDEGNPEELDARIGSRLMNLLSKVPHIDPKKFNGDIQDLLMVIYLANVTRAQVALSDKICASLNV